MCPHTAAFAVCCLLFELMLLLCSRLAGMLRGPAHPPDMLFLDCCSPLRLRVEPKSHSLMLLYGIACLCKKSCSAADLDARYQIGKGHPHMLEKATQRLAAMFDIKQVDTAKEEQLYVFSAVEHAPKAAGRMGAVLNISAQVRTMNCMVVSVWRGPFARCQCIRPRS